MRAAARRPDRGDQHAGTSGGCEGCWTGRYLALLLAREEQAERVAGLSGKKERRELHEPVSA